MARKIIAKIPIKQATERVRIISGLSSLANYCLTKMENNNGNDKERFDELREMYDTTISAIEMFGHYPRNFARLEERYRRIIAR